MTFFNTETLQDCIFLLLMNIPKRMY